MSTKFFYYVHLPDIRRNVFAKDDKDDKDDIDKFYFLSIISYPFFAIVEL
jgi:hypothetical protein